MATKLKHGMAKGLYAGKHPAWVPTKAKRRSPNQRVQAKANRGGYR